MRKKERRQLKGTDTNRLQSPGRPPKVRKTKRIRRTTPMSLRARRDKKEVVTEEIQEETIIEPSEAEKLLKGSAITQKIRARAMLKIKLPDLRKTRHKKKHATDVFNRTDWKSTIIHMMSKGAGLLEVLAELGLTRAQHYKLMQRAREEDATKKDLAYRSAMERGLELAEAWWTQTGREGLVLGKGFNSHLYFMNMKNRFNWGDNMKVDLGEDTLKTIQSSIVSIAKGNATEVLNKDLTKESERKEEIKQAREDKKEKYKLSL